MFFSYFLKLDVGIFNNNEKKHNEKTFVYFVYSQILRLTYKLFLKRFCILNCNL